MTMKESTRKAAAKAENIREFIKKKAEEGEDDKVDMNKLAKDLADRRERVLKEEEAE